MPIFNGVNYTDAQVTWFCSSTVIECMEPEDHQLYHQMSRDMICELNQGSSLQQELFGQGETLPANMSGPVTVNLSDGTTVTLDAGDTIPANIVGCIVVDEVTGKPAPVGLDTDTRYVVTSSDNSQTVTPGTTLSGEISYDLTNPDPLIDPLNGTWRISSESSNISLTPPNEINTHTNQTHSFRVGQQAGLGAQSEYLIAFSLNSALGYIGDYVFSAGFNASRGAIGNDHIGIGRNAAQGANANGVTALGANSAFGSTAFNLFAVNGAGGNSAGGNVNAAGIAAFFNGNGQQINAFGSNALIRSIGSNVIAMGAGAGADQNGVSNAYFGLNAGARINGSGNFVGGPNAGTDAITSDSTFIGALVGQNAMGDDLIGIGRLAMIDALGDDIMGIGAGAARETQGERVSAVGYQAFANGQGEDVVTHGFWSARLAQGDKITSIGSRSNVVTIAGPPQAVTVNPATNQITFTGHGLGVAGDRVNLEINATMLPAGVANIWHTFVIIDANTLEFVSADPTTAGVGVTAAVNLSAGLSNWTSVGYEAISTASNQVTLGDANVTDVVSAGDATFNGMFYPSDSRLKKNFKKLTTVTDRLSQIDVGTFEWDFGSNLMEIAPARTENIEVSPAKYEFVYDDEGKFVEKRLIEEAVYEEQTFDAVNRVPKREEGKVQHGVLADNVQMLFPEMVKTKEDGSLAVDYVKLSMMAIAAIGEMDTRIKDLEAQVRS